MLLNDVRKRNPPVAAEPTVYKYILELILRLHIFISLHILNLPVKIFLTIKVLSYEELILDTSMLRSEWLQEIKWNVKFSNNSLSIPSGTSIQYSSLSYSYHN